MATLGEVNRFAFRSELRYNILLPFSTTYDCLNYLKHCIVFLDSVVVCHVSHYNILSSFVKGILEKKQNKSRIVVSAYCVKSYARRAKKGVRNPLNANVIGELSV